MVHKTQKTQERDDDDDQVRNRACDNAPRVWNFGFQKRAKTRDEYLLTDIQILSALANCPSENCRFFHAFESISESLMQKVVDKQGDDEVNNYTQPREDESK